MCIDLTPRKLIDVNSNLTSELHKTTPELDSHADTCVLGREALIILDFPRPVLVQGYDPALGSKKYSTVSGVVSYADPQTATEYHLVIHQAIYIPHLDHHLLCPM